MYSGLHLVRKAAQNENVQSQEGIPAIQSVYLDLEKMEAKDEEHMIKLLQSLSISKVRSVEFIFEGGSKRRFHSHINTECLTIRDGECRKRVPVPSFGGFIEEGASVADDSYIGRFAIVLNGAFVEAGAVLMGSRTICAGAVVNARDPDMDIWP